MNVSLSEPLNEQELDELDEFLQSLESDDAILNLSELDGLLTAVVSGPEVVPVAAWLESIWGGEGNEPDWESVEQAEHILSLMLRHMNTTSLVLMESPEDFEPIFMEGEFEGQSFLQVDDWCGGDVRGVQLCGTRWQEMSEEMERELSPILVFGMEDGLDYLTGATDEQIEALQQEVAPAARRLHAYWLEQRTGEA